MALITSDPARNRRIAVGILFAVLALAIAIIAIPVWMVNRHYDTALEEAAGRLERYRRIAATRPEVVKSLEAMRAHDPRRFFLRSGSAALSAAEAQEAVRAIVEASGGRLITMQAPNTRDEGRYRQVTVNVQLTANVIALRKILNAIETRTPYLFVDNLMVRSTVASSFRPGLGNEPEMFVQFDVSGYSLSGSST